MKTKRRFTIVGIIVGALLTLAPAFGLLGTVFGMMRSFNTLGSSGVADPKVLSDGIGITLVSTAAGLILFPVGITIFTLSLIFYFQFRALSPPPLPAQQSR